MSRPTPQHAPMHQFAEHNGELMVGNRPLKALAAEIGTPFYVYDRAVMQDGLAALRAALPQGIDIHYALKANPFPALVNFIAPHVDGLDVASQGELEVALAAGTPPTAISMAGPGKTDALLQSALSAGICINVESANELQRLAGLARASGIRARIALRINPDFELKSAGMRMGGGASPFGIDAEQAPALLAQIPALPVGFLGFHF